MDELTPEEFTRLMLIAAAPPNRVGEVVARLVGDEITIGPISVGPGDVATATAVGKRGVVRASPCEDPDWHQIITVPIDLTVTVDIAGRVAEYRGAVEVRTRIRMRLERPCTVAVQIEDVAADNVEADIEATGFAARLLGYVGSIDETVHKQVLDQVNEMVRSPEFEAALHIDVIGLMERAWDAGLVVQLPDEDRTTVPG
ncbi:MAG: Uncharacterized protein JWR37_1227 [Mycobacterium sp.]|jgi:hypothetical protein|nr:Uncharacterized protein [Mycobacterium sp.]